jgi:hypothetical protein
MTPNADSGRVIEPRCPMSISGMCLQMVEGFAPCDDISECEYAPNPLPLNGRSVS